MAVAGAAAGVAAAGSSTRRCSRRRCAGDAAARAMYNYWRDKLQPFSSAEWIAGVRQFRQVSGDREPACRPIARKSLPANTSAIVMSALQSG